MRRKSISLIFCVIAFLGACSESPWNNPYPVSDEGQNILYDSFSERPKHLDPVRSYSANEYAFIAQIYEPPLQYHFLKRPYELVPLSSDGMPELYYYDAEQRRLPDNAKVEEIASSVYRVRIQKNIHYQPHPAFARDQNQELLYHGLTPDQISRMHTLADFPQTGSRELSAEDFVYQIKRLAHPALHSPIGGLMAEHVDGMKEFAAELLAARKKLQAEQGAEAELDLRDFDFVGARVIDRYTYEIRIKGKYPQFIYWMAMPFFAPMPWEAVAFYQQPGMTENNITLDWYPVGSGPYMLTENNPNLRMTLQRNPNFHGESYPQQGMPEDRDSGLLKDAGQPLPFIDKAVYNLEKEAIPYWNKFLQGYYDASGINSDSFDQAVQFNVSGDAQLTDEMRQRDMHLLTAVTTSSYYMGFNMNDPVVGGDTDRARLLRRAISIAMNYEEFISIFANGRGTAAQGPIPPGIFGNLEGEAGINPYVYEWVNNKPRRRSIDEAKALLREAGYPDGRDMQDGKPLVLYFDTPAAGPGSKSMLAWLRKQFQLLGVQLVIRATDYNRFQEKMYKGTAQIFQWGWNADYPDPENFMFLLYGPNAKVEFQGENAANYKNPEFDALFEKMKNMDNGEPRQQVINQMVEILRVDAPWLWGYHPKAFSLHHAWYKNAKPNLMANNTLKYKRIVPELRAEKRLAWNQPVLTPLVIALLVLLVSLIPAVISYRRREQETLR